MSFNKGNNVRNFQAPRNQNQNSGYDSKKVDAYINMAIPVRRQDGSKGTSKIGAIELRMSNDIQSRILAAFREDPEGAKQRLIDALEIDFREANANEGAEVLF